MDKKRIQDLFSKGRHQECLQMCQQLLQSEPENPFPWKYAGKSLQALRELQKAQKYLNKADQIDPTDPEIPKVTAEQGWRRPAQTAAAHPRA